jgi:hypothetical protein
LHCLDARFGWWDDRDIAIGKAEAYARRALEIDPGNADAYTTSSLILLLQGRYDEAWQMRGRPSNWHQVRLIQRNLRATFSHHPAIPMKQSCSARKQSP